MSFKERYNCLSSEQHINVNDNEIFYARDIFRRGSSRDDALEYLWDAVTQKNLKFAFRKNNY